MLCTQFSFDELNMRDDSARILRPIMFLETHYDYIRDSITYLLHRYGKHLCGVIEDDVINELYVLLKRQERRGIWAPDTVGTDAEKMCGYLLGRAKSLICVWDSKEYQYNSLPVWLHDDAWDLDDALDRQKQQEKLRKTLDKLHDLFLDFGFDMSYMKAEQDEALKDIDTYIKILMCVCCVTSDEMQKLHKLNDRLMELRR